MESKSRKSVDVCGKYKVSAWRNGESIECRSSNLRVSPTIELVGYSWLDVAQEQTDTGLSAILHLLWMRICTLT
jgi:hypothetical protein